MSRYDLLKAIGNVDEESVREAKEKDKPRKAIWITLGSLAACLMLVYIIPIAMNIFNAGDMGNDHAPEAEKPDVMYNIGTSVTTDRGTITMTEHDVENHTVSFIFEKVNDNHYGFRFVGFSNDGEIVYNVFTPYDYTNLEPYPEDAIIKFEGLTYIVNGEKVENLSFASGRYEVVVDYSGMYEYCDTVSTRILVIGFGMFDFGNAEMQEVLK